MSECKQTIKDRTIIQCGMTGEVVDVLSPVPVVGLSVSSVIS